MSKALKIGELAERAGVTPRTIRYYEELNIIRPVSHSEKGFRLYSESTLDRLNFIKDLKDLDFCLEEIKNLIFNIDSCATGRELANILMPLLREKHNKAAEKINTYTKIKENMQEYYHALKDSD
jgi:DNA-binding transcriptional MerR regulator